MFIARHPAWKGTDIARQLKKDKAQVYHIFKSCAKKGVVESTLESPLDFTPVPFEMVVEMAIKSKRNEAAQIESIKQELLENWNNIRKVNLNRLLRNLLL